MRLDGGIMGYTHCNSPQVWMIHSILFFFNGDGKLDIFHSKPSKFNSISPIKDEWRVSYSGGTTSFEHYGYSYFNMKHNNGNEIQFGDFNGDGITDIFRATNNKWYVNYGARNSWSEINGSAILMQNLRFGDFNGDGATDVFTIFEHGEWMMSFNGITKWEYANISNQNINELQFGDFDGDGKTDIFINWGNGKWYVSYNGGNLGAVVLNESGHPLHDLLFEDLNGDGKTDIIVKPEAPYGQRC